MSTWIIREVESYCSSFRTESLIVDKATYVFNSKVWFGEGETVRYGATSTILSMAVKDWSIYWTSSFKLIRLRV